VSINLQVAAHLFASRRYGVARADHVSERRPKLGPVSIGLEVLLRDTPFAPLESAQEGGLDTLNRSAYYRAQSPKLSIIGIDFHQHLEAGDEAHRLKGEAAFGNLSFGDLGFHLLPPPGGLTVGIKNARDPLVPPTDRPGFCNASRILQDVPR